MGYYELTEQADEDIIELADYVASDSPDAAFRLIDRIFQKCQTLADNPRLGRRRDELLPGIRSFPVGNYLIFYEPSDFGVHILRVVHGARDLNVLFEEQQD